MGQNQVKDAQLLGARERIRESQVPIHQQYQFGFVYACQMDLVPRLHACVCKVATNPATYGILNKYN